MIVKKLGSESGCFGVAFVIVKQFTGKHVGRPGCHICFVNRIPASIKMVLSLALQVTINEVQIEVKAYAGFGRAKTYYWYEIEGYKTAILPARHGSYEYLYIFREGKVIVRLSEFYHRNYRELKIVVSRHARDLGMEPFNFWKEIKQMFK